MPLDEFWHGDMRLLDCYQKAYYRDKSYTAWQNGAYVFEAHSKVIYNGFGRSKGAKAEQYAEWKDPIPDKPKPQADIDSVELEYRRLQAEQQDWLANMLRK